MKVIKIRSSQSGEKVYWWSEFENEEHSLFTPTKPLFTEGSDILKESLELKTPKGLTAKGEPKKPYWVIPDKPKDAPTKPSESAGVGQKKIEVSPYQKDSDKIMLQVAFKGAVELYNQAHAVRPLEIIDTASVLNITEKLYVGLQLLAASTTREKK